MRTSWLVRMVPAIVTGALLAGVAAAQHGQAPDSRQAISLPSHGRETVLAEMRHMLESVNGVLQGVVTGDLPAVEKAARASGAGAAVDSRMQMMGLLPSPFAQLGMQTHQGFDALADQAKAGAGRDELVRGLARITGNCVACHSIYRLEPGG
jgi:mono/diheme cytochrome c family protein